ncbi:MAG: hypothetical protein H0W83_08730 [Planctomycetes bacterium]|nr:hypothetical protein [Planctomycetota bacterium]
MSAQRRIVWALAREHPRWRWGIRAVFLAFALTILTTKQHYAVDLVGGLTTAAIGVVASSAFAARLRSAAAKA